MSLVYGKTNKAGFRMERGEICWYKFKSPDKKRPVVILTRNSAINYLSEITIAPITSTIRIWIIYKRYQNHELGHLLQN
jgi:mRNA-degrading endonuclease toxin of MazEF toxin-antitoxin module